MLYPVVEPQERRARLDLGPGFDQALGHLPRHPRLDLHAVPGPHRADGLVNILIGDELDRLRGDEGDAPAPTRPAGPRLPSTGFRPEADPLGPAHQQARHEQGPKRFHHGAPFPVRACQNEGVAPESPERPS